MLSFQQISRRNRLRIGIYEPSRTPSGPSRYVESILSAIDPNEFEIILFCRKTSPYQPRPGITLHPVDTDSPASTKPEKVAQDIKPRRLPAITPNWLRLWSGFGRETIRLANHFASNPVDLLHTNNAGCEESAVAAKLAGIPAVLGTFHVDSTYDLARKKSSFRHRLLEHLSNHCLDAAIAVSHATARNWIERTHIPPPRVTTIHNGINPDYFERTLDRAAARQQLGLPINSLIIGGIGRLDHAKGFNTLIDAAAILVNNHPTLQIALAGKGPLRQSLQEQATHLGIANRVHFLGFCPDIRIVHAAIDIFAMPSRCEALPYALLEAMSAELPSVATDVGGVAEVIQPNQTGHLVPQQNPSALASALQPLLTNQNLRQQMGQAARQRVIQHFNEPTMIDNTLKIYRQFLRRPAQKIAA